MAMKVHRLLQGSPEWLAHRAQHWNAADAPVMLGCSPHRTRREFLDATITGIQPEFSDFAQRKVIDPGHEYEEQARTLGAAIIGEDLFRITGSIQLPGLERGLSASFDGLPMDAPVPWEHKRLNAELRGLMVPGCTADVLPKRYRVQMEQQLLVCGGERALFMASEWRKEGAGWVLVEERHCWYRTDPLLRAEIIMGWQQLAAEAAGHVPGLDVLPPTATAAPVATLPAVIVQVQGSLAISDNLPAYRTALVAFIERIPTKPSTDQEFADTEAACKALEAAEKALQAEEDRALAGLANVDTMRKLFATLREMASTVRLARIKMVDQRKAELRTEQVQRGQRALAAHCEKLTQRLGDKDVAVRVPQVDFGAAAKGKRSVATVRDAVEHALAAGRITANQEHALIEGNLRTLAALLADYKLLVPDKAALVRKDAEAFRAIIEGRIAQSKLLDAQRATTAPTPAPTAPPAPNAIQPGPATPALDFGAGSIAAGWRTGAPAGSGTQQPPAADDDPFTAPPQAPRTLTLGAVCKRLGVTMSGTFVAETLLVVGEHGKAGALLYNGADFDLICRRLAAHAHGMRETYAAVTTTTAA